MKIRTDFITNSSSSSFVIMAKENLTDEQLKNELMRAINAPSSGNVLIPNLADKIATVLTFDLRDLDIHEYINEYTAYDKITELKQGGLESRTVYKYYEEYPYIKMGSVADDSDDPMEVMLVDMNIKFRNDKIVVVKDGGY